MAGKIRMIAMDMDGTLLRKDGTISPRTIEALDKARAQGVVIALCTGRFAQNGAIMARSNGLGCDYVIASNGCMLWNEREKRIIKERTMDVTAAQQAAEIVKRYSSRFNIVSGHYVVDSVGVHSTVKRFEGGLMDEYQISFGSGEADVDDIISRPIYKIFMYRFDDADELDRCAKELEEVPNVYLTCSGERNLEVMPLGVDKGTGLSDMAQMLGIDMEDVMVFGDYDNDLPMFRMAGYPVAMGNGNDNVKKIARYVTDTNENDGIAKAIEKFVLE